MAAGTKATHESRLTPSGSAVELGFVWWPGVDIRLTVDPAPLQAPRERLLRCAEAMTAPLEGVQGATVAEIRSWSEDSACRYGGWLGLRRRKGRCTSKLYVEIPANAPSASWEEQWAGSRSILKRRGSRPVMVGLDPVRGGIEIYYRLHGLCRRGLKMLLDRFGFGYRQGEIISALEALTRRSIRFDLPSDDLGFSVAFSQPGQPLTLTLYSVGDALLGQPEEARTALLAYGATRGDAMSEYAALSAPNAAGQVPEHCLVGFILPRSPTAGIGLTATLPLDLGARA